MTFPRGQVPEAVWRAGKAADRERLQAETDWDNYLAAKPAPARKLSQWEQVKLENARLEAIVPLGPVDVCVGCGWRAVAQDGIYVCAFCGYGWACEDDT